MHELEHRVQFINDPNSTNPPEYLISGATSVPVIRKSCPLSQKEFNVDECRQSLKLFKLKDLTLNTFYSLLFSNEVFFLDSYDSDYILNLVKEAVAVSGRNDLIVCLNFQIAPDGTFLLIEKFFYTKSHKPYAFDNKLSSTLLVQFSKELKFPYFSIKDEDGNLVRYKETVYRFHERLYVEININYPEKNRILPLVIAYDEFGVVWAEFFYCNRIISKEVLRSIKPEFDDRVIDFNYFSQDEIDSLSMLFI